MSAQGFSGSSKERLLQSDDFSDVLMEGMLSLPHGLQCDSVVTLTCVVVIFSILVQGLGIGPLVRKTLSAAR